MNAFILLCLTILFDTSTTSEWSYKDQTHWDGQCNIGTQQSPINIVTGDAIADTHGRYITRPLNYEGAATIDLAINNGHSIDWEQDRTAPIPVLSGGPLSSNYSFWQFHLHWPSEHAVDGRKFPLELHLVHVKTGYSLEEAELLPDGMAALSILCEVSEGWRAGEALSDIMSVVPQLSQPNSNVTTPQVIDFTQILAPNLQSFFTYEGSFTTPHCNEVVTWIVMEKPIPILEEQIEILKTVDVGGVDNVRSLQPINRIVYQSTFSSSASMLSPGFASFLAAIIFYVSLDLMWLSSLMDKYFRYICNIKKSDIRVSLHNFCGNFVNCSEHDRW